MQLVTISNYKEMIFFVMDNVSHLGFSYSVTLLVLLSLHGLNDLIARAIYKIFR